MDTENKDNIINQLQHKYDLMARERTYWKNRSVELKKAIEDLSPVIEKLKDQIYNLSKNKKIKNKNYEDISSV